MRAIVESESIESAPSKSASATKPPTPINHARSLEQDLIDIAEDYFANAPASREGTSSIIGSGQAPTSAEASLPPPAPLLIENQKPHGRQKGQPVQLRNENQSSTDGLRLTIKTLGNLLDDLEKIRKDNGNRVGATERTFGASLPALDVAQAGLAAVEHEAELELKRAWRKHPLREWAAGYPGVGEKLIARLIAEIGDPGERPNPAKLWAYCGLGDPARKRRAGMTQEEAFKLGNPNAKKICWLIGESFVKVNRGPGRERYDAARLKYADRVHDKPCIRCGPSGKPADTGSPWSLKHQHEAAKRYAVKMFLKELWIASRQQSGEALASPARGEQASDHTMPIHAALAPNGPATRDPKSKARARASHLAKPIHESPVEDQDTGEAHRARVSSHCCSEAHAPSVGVTP